MSTNHPEDHNHTATCGCGCGCDPAESATQAQNTQITSCDHDHDHSHANHDHAHAHAHEQHHNHDHAHAHEPAHAQAGAASGCSCGCELASQNPHVHTQDDGCGCGHDHAHETNRREQVTLLVALVLFIGGIVLGDWGWPAFLGAYLLAGFPVLKQMLLNFRHGRIFDENTLMSIASLGAWAVGAYLEAAAVMLLYRIGEAIQARAVLKSRQAIAALTDIRPASARLLQADGSLQEIKPELVKPGQQIQVRPGERLPVDGRILSGKAHLDLSALTGESLPLAVSEGMEVKAGAINQDGLLVLEAIRSYEDSAVAQILRLLEESGANKAPIESMISAFARRYTPLVTLAAVLLFAIPTLAGGDLQIWLYRALVFLAASCPCALIISVPLTYYAGLGAAAKIGALIKGGNFLSALPNVKTVVFDKTGTLTEGRFRVSGIHSSGNYSQDELLYLAARAEAASNHPLAQAICAAYQEKTGKVPTAAESLREEAGLGVIAELDGQQVLVGNGRLLQQYGMQVQEDGETALHVAFAGQYIGSIAVQDRVKPQAAAAIQELRQLGVTRTVLLSGDTPQHAQRIAQQLGIDEAQGGLLPEDKVSRLQELIRNKQPDQKLLFMGDGINDAPSLALADIGVAMGALGAEAATAAADMVLLQDDPQQLTQAMRIARRTNRIARQNIVFSLSIKLAVLILSAIGISGMAAAVFADVGVALLAVANGMRAMRLPRTPKAQKIAPLPKTQQA